MKKINLTYLGLLLLLITFSCSSDDDNSGNTQNINGFTFNGTFYSVPQVYINDENIIDNNPSDLTIIMSNVNLLTANQTSGVNFVYMDYTGTTFETGSITSLPDYRIIENAGINALEISGGTTLLDDNENGLTANVTLLTINSISPTSIDFTFSFTREDGEVVSGNYSGSYTDISDL